MQKLEDFIEKRANTLMVGLVIATFVAIAIAIGLKQKPTTIQEIEHKGHDYLIANKIAITHSISCTLCSKPYFYYPTTITNESTNEK